MQDMLGNHLSHRCPFFLPLTCFWCYIAYIPTTAPFMLSIKTTLKVSRILEPYSKISYIPLETLLCHL